MIRFDFNTLCALNFYICKNSEEPYQIINKNNILSALSVYDSYFNNKKEIMAALFRSLIINHGFLNGNKRTAAMCLYVSGIYLKRSQKEFIDITYEIAKGNLKDAKEIAKLLFYDYEVDEGMKFKKKRNYNINRNAGDVELSSSIFNNSVSPNIGTMGEDIDSYDKSAEKERIFNEIKKLNPNADKKNYNKKSVRQMLAILNNYRDGKKRLTKKPISLKYKKKGNKEYTYNDIYRDSDTDDYMIKGFQIGFETQKEAEDFVKDLNSDEE